MSEATRRAAARSAARMKKTRDPAPQAPAAPDPEGVIKTSPRGTMYRVYTVPLMAYPKFMEKKGFVPKMYFYFAPEGEEVLGVRKKDDPEAREL